ncbi:MAG: DsrE family protein [Gramella sp.]|nr:DsrE family protein [Christiangramia sp.]
MNKILVLFFLFFSTISFSQELISGNVIPDYGKTYLVESPEFKTDTTSILKVVFDVGRSFDPAEPNKLIETAARFLNMHEMAGVNPDKMKIALVLHGKSVQDVLQDEVYSQRFPDEERNPNLPLIAALKDKGVRVILCGQSATHYGVTRKNTDDHVDFALSAMTALVQLQNDEYRLINF